MLLAFGVWLGVPAVLRKTGLSEEQPSESIHAMARGPLAAAGGLYEADMVFDALAGVGVDLATRRTRWTSAAPPGASCGSSPPHTRTSIGTAATPTQPAIAWAAENLPGDRVLRQRRAPPLPLADGSLDLAYAISIWSHFEPALGLRWFEEMHRADPPRRASRVHDPRPDLDRATTRRSSCAPRAVARRSPTRSTRRGWWYAPEFGEEGDWGVVNPDWGTAFVSPEWMLTQLCPRWRVLEFAPGRNQDNQDVYVLQRA